MVEASTPQPQFIPPVSAESSSSKMKNNGIVHHSTPRTDLFVFGQDNPNKSFTFKLTNMISNIGSSVFNIFRSRKN